MDRPQIRFAGASDSVAIASLFRSSFSPEIAQLLIHGCAGASEYIRSQIASGIPNAESMYLVAEASAGLLGAVEMRRRPNGLFLNYIAVSPERRRQRVAASLLLEGLRLLGDNSGRIELDVFHDNIAAVQWYGRLGFGTITSVEFLELPPACVGGAEPAYVSGMPQADLCQERFGFSTFNLITGKGTFPVGRIGDAWFRLSDPVAVDDPAIFAALRLLDPARRIFAVVPPSRVPPAQVVCLLNRTYRMGADILPVMSSLANDRQGR
jgi:GNAT superfamily N-acetyltransferase